jgi:colicin import membrane protein
MAQPEEPQAGAPATAFSVVRHGYDRTQVNRHIRQAEAVTRRVTTERDHYQRQVTELSTQLDAARAQIATLTERVDALTADAGAAGRDERTNRVLAIAKSQATEITERARVAAEETWSAAEHAAATLRERYERLLADLDREHKEIQAVAGTTVAAMTTEAERRRREIDAAAEADRIRIDREFSESMNAKRNALRREIETARATSTEEATRRVREATEAAETRIREADEAAERRIREANETADRRLAAATAEVDRLAALRDQLAAQLRDTHQLVERVTATLAPAEAEMSFEDTLLLPPPVRVDEKK